MRIGVSVSASDVETLLHTIDEAEATGVAQLWIAVAPAPKTVLIGFDESAWHGVGRRSTQGLADRFRTRQLVVPSGRLERSTHGLGNDSRGRD